ncbi:DUF2275 domain-containing protein [Desulfitobacterium sp. THU1]|uniref:DUF2275 domain-containing protein n=1 Tax=Desulfitobacterium sp. THU1 TaxID=3138072 RepID=UPI00311F8F99
MIKRSIRGLRMGAFVALLFIAVGVIGVSMVNNRAGTLTDQDIFKTKDVAMVLKEAGLDLKISREPALAPRECALGGVEPKVFDMGDGLSQLYIYEFASALDRRNTLDELSGRGETNFQDPFSRDPFAKAQKLSRAYGAKNMVMVLVYNITFENMERENINLTPITLTVGRTIFYELNQGRKFVLQGEGEHWEGKLVVSVYEEQWTDERGYARTQRNSIELPLVRYKGNPEEVRDYTYKFEWPGGASGVTSEDGFRQGNFDDERSSVYGGSNLWWGNFGFGTGSVPKEDDTCDFSAQWNGGAEEQFTLKAQ